MQTAAKVNTCRRQVCGAAIQALLLPAVFPNTPQFKIYVRFQSAGDGMLLSKPYLVAQNLHWRQRAHMRTPEQGHNPGLVPAAYMVMYWAALSVKAALSAWLLLPPSSERGSVSCQTWRVSLQMFRVRIVFKVSLGAVIPARASFTF